MERRREPLENRRYGREHDRPLIDGQGRPSIALFVGRSRHIYRYGSAGECEIEFARHLNLVGLILMR